MSDEGQKSYRFLTNLMSPVDQVDGNFLNVLADYRIGPPQETPKKSVEALVLDGVFGVYTTADAMTTPQMQKLTGFNVRALSDVALGS